MTDQTRERLAELVKALRGWPGSDTCRAAADILDTLSPASGGVSGEDGEWIVRAAIKWGEAVYSVPPPGRHGDVFRLMSKNLAESAGPDDQGFLTSTGRFVGRFEARDIAQQAGQLLPDARAHSELFSEDVW